MYFIKGECDTHKVEKEASMATPSLYLSITLFLVGLLLPTTSTVHSDKHSAALFTFGDSLYDPGNNNYINTTTDFKADFPPYGESFFTTPPEGFPMAVSSPTSSVKIPMYTS